MKGRKSKSWAMAYCGMAAALSVVLMLLGAVFPIAMFIAPAVASFLIATVCVECGKTMALTAYGAVSLLSLLFVPDKEVALTFVFLLGYYPLAKPYFERIRPALLRAVCKLLLCNGGILAMYGLVLLLVPAGSIAEELRTTLSRITYDATHTKHLHADSPARTRTAAVSLLRSVYVLVWLSLKGFCCGIAAVFCPSLRLV